MSGGGQMPKDAHPIEIGQIDPMSRTAARTNLPLCDKKHLHKKHTCTRVRGHDESSPEHPSTQHVAVDRDFVARGVW